jgi:hypothetical protein
VQGFSDIGSHGSHSTTPRLHFQPPIQRASHKSTARLPRPPSPKSGRGPLLRDRKRIRQQPNPILDPLASMFEAATSEFVRAAQKGTSNASCHDVEIARFIRRSKLVAWISHAGSVPRLSCRHHQKFARFTVGNLLGFVGVP